MSKGDFQKLYELDVNHKTKEKSGLKYLSWAWAWAEFKKVNSGATYSVDLYDGKPFLSDKDLGYMVSTTVTVGDLTIPMHLPVLDGAKPRRTRTAPSTRIRSVKLRVCLILIPLLCDASQRI
jgi:hypothetical protein